MDNKAYYNQAEYAQGDSKRKDDVAPPPPYSWATQGGSGSSSASSPALGRGSSDAGYGAVPSQPSSPSLYPPLNQGFHHAPSAPPLRPDTTPDASSTYTPSAPQPTSRSAWNPHLPRDWIPDKVYNKLAPHIPPNVQIPAYMRRGLDDDDDDRDRGCCKSWCKWIFLLILLWVVLVKYQFNWTFLGGDGDGDHGLFWRCNNEPLVTWDEMPTKMEVLQDLAIDIEGPVTVSQSHVNVYVSSDRDVGWIESRVRVSRNILNDNDLFYKLEHGDDSNGKQTRLLIHLPPSYSHRVACSQVQLNVYLPDKINLLHVNVNNMPINVKPSTGRLASMDAGDDDDDDDDDDSSNLPAFVRHRLKHLDLNKSNNKMRMAKDDVGGVLETDRVELSTRNSLIDFDIGRWEGDSLHLQSTNGLVRVTGELDADDWIQIETTNGAIETYRKCTAQNRLVLATTNARISSTSLIVAKETGELNLHTTNGAIVTTDLTSANDIIFRSTNNGLDIANAYARNSIQLITSNSHIKARIAGEKTINARVVTSNSAVNLAMTREFQGEVDLDTSRSNRANLYDDKTELDTNQKNHKHGYRLSHDGGKLSVKTSNSHIDVTFDA